jgi:hypothetical protein
MAQTQAGVFVPQAQQEVKSLLDQYLRVQMAAQKLQAQWNELGKDAMRGWQELDWTAYGFTATELKTALNKLDNLSSMSLVDLSAGLQPLRKIV